MKPFAVEDLPRPNDPRPRYEALRISLPGGCAVEVKDDAYSQRLRCDHPTCDDSEALGAALLTTARDLGHGRVLVFADAEHRGGLETAGLRIEATMAGFYRGQRDCIVAGAALDDERGECFDPEGVRQVRELIEAKRGEPIKERQLAATERASADDAEAIAELVTATFPHYPTPTGVPAYVAEQIAAGVPFRLVRDNGEVVACASADLVREARTAELTDCATRPDQRGRGLMQALLVGLMDDLRALDYPTAFTLARARQAGMNLAFLRLGFHYDGLLTRSCRIGDGLEDITVWSRAL